MKLYIGLDFDGSLTSHEYPRVGQSIGSEPWLKKLVDAGAQLVLNTMRSGKELDDAVQWFKEREIPLYGINENPTQKAWTDSPKAYAHVYVDDAALGCPLIHPGLGMRPYVDWEKVGPMLMNMIEGNTNAELIEIVNKND